jgi:hypothetical protein
VTFERPIGLYDSRPGGKSADTQSLAGRGLLATITTILPAKQTCSTPRIVGEVGGNADAGRLIKSRTDLSTLIDRASARELKRPAFPTDGSVASKFLPQSFRENAKFI